MSDITTRSGKGSPLTNNEVDANFTNLNTDKLESGDLSVVIAPVGSASLAYNSGVFTYTPPDLTAIDLSLYATLAGATFTGPVIAPTFEGSLDGNQLFKAKAGEAITKGHPVYISGISGNTPIVMEADADDPTKMPAFGLASDTVAINAAVNVVTYGQLHGLDTTPYALGAPMYVSTTPGGLSATAPTGESSLIQNMGKVERVHDTVGTIFVAGAGRSNATPNLNNGNFFLGNASNQAVSADFSAEVATQLAGTVVLGDVSTTGSVEIDGDLTVNGTTVTINATELALEDNMIYLNEGSAVLNPDLGIAGGYNDGTYAHAGIFRDASDGVWKIYDGYTLEPDASAYIDITHASFTLSDMQVNTLYADGGNSTNWNTAYGWGDHSLAGYLTSYVDTNTTYTAGTGLSLDGTVFSNSAPDQTVTLTGGGATAVTGTYPDFTVTSTDTDTVYTHPTSHSIGFITGLQAALDGKVDDTQVLTNVPAGAVFTDTVYTHPTSHSISFITGLQTALDGKVDDSQVLTDVPAGAVFTDTVYTLPFTDNSGQWDTAYGWGDHAGNYLPLSGGTVTGATTFTDSIDMAYSVGNTFNLLCNNTGSQTLNIASNNLDAGVDKYIYIGKNTGANAGNSTFIELGDDASGSLVKAFGNFQATGTVTATDGNSGQWNTAYGWGDHASAGYLTSVLTPVNGSWWNSGFVKVGNDGVMEVGKYLDFHTSNTGGNVDYDLRVTASPGALAVGGTIAATGGNSTNWNTAYGWGDHATAGYLPSSSYTASDVLTKIKTVDGSGSGLDADLLDGKQKESFNPVAARYITTAGASGRLRITLPFLANSTKMLSFKISGYGQYDQWEYQVSGYLYPTSNNWYLPKVVFTGTANPDIQMGRDANGYAYVSIPQYNYMGVTVHSITMGYTSSVANAYEGWSITNDATTAPNQVTPTVSKAWHSTNDGPSSGLNADLLDGQHGSSFVRSDADDTKSGNLILQTSGAATNTATGLLFETGGTYSDGRWRTRFRKQDKGGGIPFYIDTSSATANVYTETVRIGTYSGNPYELEVFGDINATGSLYDGGNAVWHAGNDGPGSGLNADLLDGQHGSYYAPASHVHSYLPLAGGTLTGGLTGTTATFSGNAQVGGALKITEAGTAQNLLMGNQDSGGTNKPAMIMGVNGYLRFGHGSSWSGEGGTFTEKLRVDNDTDVISGNFQIGSTTVIDSNRNLTNIGTVSAAGRITLNTNRTFTGLEATSGANGRSQVLLSSYYSDVVIASQQTNANHGSTISFTSSNPANSADYRKFVINQGNWGGTHLLRFAWRDGNYTNPHDYVNGSFGGSYDSLGINGQTKVVYAFGEMHAPIFKDYNNTAYYLDPADTSVLNLLHTARYGRTAHNSGYLVGGYNNIGASGGKSSPIYSIGSAYSANETNLGNLYGIGYSTYSSTLAGVSLTGAQDWGMYVAASGTARVWLDGTTGNISAYGNSYAQTFYDSNNTDYYVDPSHSTTSAKFAGGVTMGPYKQYITGNLTASGTQARTFEIAKIAFDYNDWATGQGELEVELHTTYYNSGIKKRYSVSVGYHNHYSVKLLEFTGNGDNNAQVRIGAPVLVSGDVYTVSVYVDVRYYSHVRAKISTVRNVTASSSPSAGYTYINIVPSAVNIADFSADTISFHRDAQFDTLRSTIYYDSNNTGYYVDASSTSLSINVAGSIVAGGNITAYSDRKVKDNIEPITNALDKVQQLNGVTFNRIDLSDKTKRYAGLIAQDIEKVLPEAVDDDVIKRVDYNATIGLLVEAIKELTAKVETLETKLAQKEQ